MHGGRFRHVESRVFQGGLFWNMELRMSKYYFMRPVLIWLARPENFNHMMAMAFRITAVLVVPFGLVVFFKAGKVIFDLPATEILGGILFELVFAVAIYCVVHTLYIRARDIESLAADLYNMFPLMAMVVRATGEALAVFIGLVSVGGAAYVWFTAKAINTILNPLPQFLPVFGGSNFMGGIQLMVGGMLSALLLLAASYLLAEGLHLIVDTVRRPSGQPQTPATSEEEAGYRRRSGTG
jgi:hypothetical protein